MPCGHEARRIGHAVLVCSQECDIPDRPTCAECGSPNIQPYDFGPTLHGKWHNERFPDAVICLTCRHVTFEGVVL